MPTEQELISTIANLAHETNRAWCSITGDYSQVAWADAPDWQRSSAENGVRFHLANPDATAEASHQNWYRDKKDDGWTYGPIKNSIERTHPCLIDYSELPVEQRVKDSLVKATVHAVWDQYGFGTYNQ